MQVVAETSSIRLTLSGLTQERPLLRVHHSTCSPILNTDTVRDNLLPFNPRVFSDLAASDIDQAPGRMSPVESPAASDHADLRIRMRRRDALYSGYL
jgi:hypothetical protein